MGDRGGRGGGGGGNLIEKSVQETEKGNNSLFLSLFSSFHKKTILSMDELEWNNTLPRLSSARYFPGN